MSKKQEDTWMIKVRKKGTTRWPWFLTPDGNGNHLRIHAALITDKERADRVAKEINDEAAYDAKVVGWNDRR